MPPDPTHRSDDRLLAALAARRPEALALLATAFGRELTAVAYLVLQQAEEASLAAASALAAAWTGGVAADAPDRERLRRHLLGQVARAALARHGQSRSVDPGTDGSWAALVRGHGPRTRAAAGLRAAGLDDVAIAAALGVATDQVRRRLAETSEAGFASALRDLQARLPVTVNAAHIQRALAAPPPPRFETRRLILGAVVAAIVLVGVWGVARSPAAPAVAEAPSSNPAAMTQAATVTTAPRPAISAAEAPRHDAVTAFTLAACDLQPIGSAIAFAGWLSAAEIGAEDLAPAGRALYVLVPEASDHADERPACVHDPAASSFTAVTLPTGWVAPVLADGCAASPFGRFAGYVEVGGPAAFLVLDRHESWHARDAELSLLVRVVPPPADGSTIEAWLVPLQGGRRVPVAVDSPPAVDDGRPNVTHYVRIREANVPFAGCWALNVAIDGSVVGSAVIPVSDPLTALP